MKRVNIYTYSTAKSPKSAKTQCEAVGYVVECETTKGPATVSGFKIIQGMSRYQSELYVFKLALNRINTMCEVHLYCECDYVAAGFEQGWIERWKASNWTTSANKEVRNRKEWEELDALVQQYQHKIVFHVKEEHTYRNWLKNNIDRFKEIHMADVRKT